MFSKWKPHNRHAAGHQIMQVHLNHTVAPGVRSHQQLHAIDQAARGQLQRQATGSLLMHTAYTSVAASHTPRGAVVLRVSNGSFPTSTTVTTPTDSNGNGNSDSLSALASDSVESSGNSNVNAASATQQQQDVASNTWEEEIEETLKLVQLLPPQGTKLMCIFLLQCTFFSRRCCCVFSSGGKKNSSCRCCPQTATVVRWGTCSHQYSINISISTSTSDCRIALGA